MNILYSSVAVITFALLQSCSSYPAQPKTSPVPTSKAGVDKAHLISTANKIDTGHKFSVPEAEIIRELYQSGCLIGEIELNRRKQQMRITCVNDKSLNSTI